MPSDVTGSRYSVGVYCILMEAQCGGIGRKSSYVVWNFQMMNHDMGNKLCGLNILAEESAIRDSCSSSIKLGVIRLRLIVYACSLDRRHSSCSTVVFI